MIKRRADLPPEDLPLLGSRLAVPPPPVGYVERPRLRRMLDAALSCPVTAVVAPAGWGKTVLLSAWLRGGESCAAWLTVEPGDAAPAWPYLPQALRSGLAANGSTGSSVLPGPVPRLPAPDYLVQLAEALCRLVHPLVLVLDNCQHLRQPELLDGLSFLVRHAGTRLRLVLAGRCEPGLPLHRWRLAGELAELAADELAFTDDEAGALLAQHGLRLPETRVRELTAHAEGWPAGLRLVARSLQRHPGPAAAVGQLSGEDQPLADYLSREVLDALPAGVPEALTSGAVPEWTSGGLLDALTGRGDGEQVLADLARTGAFVINRGTVPPTYRFHRFLRELLHARLRRHPPTAPGEPAPRTASELHRRAAGWLATHGYPAEALTHALRAAAWEYATGVFISRWPEVIAGSQHPASGEVAAPPPWPAMRGHPELALAYAADCLRQRELEAAGAYLQLAERAQHRLTGDRATRLTLMLATARVVAAQLRGEPHQVRASAAAVARADQPAPGATAIALAALGSAQLDAGELAPAAQTLARGLTTAEQAGLSCIQVACLARLALVRALRGELRAALDTALTAFDRPTCPGQAPGAHQAPAYLAAAVAHLHRDRPAEAESHLASTTALGDPALDPALAATVAIVRAELYAQQGELAAAYAALRRDRNGRRLPPYPRHRIAATEARLHTARGEPGAAAALLEPLLDQASGARAELSVVIARAHLQAGHAERAAAALPAWADDPAPPLAVRVEAGVLDAWVAAQRGDPRRCAWALEQALRLAEPEDLRRPFTTAAAPVRELLANHLDSPTAYWSLVNDLVAADRAPAPAPRLAEPLTDRELTVLRYLQSALSVAEIAAELHLSINTVKTHLRHIYRKLDATGRRETVRHARQLQLL